MSIASRVASLVGGFPILLGVATSLQAQAICSAPHSSPVLAFGGSVGALPRGAGWLQLSLYAQRSTEAFNPAGDRQRFLGGSAFVTRSAYVTGAFGVVDGIELWAQLPLHRLTSEGAAGTSVGSGLGDVRAALRLSPSAVGFDLPLALRVGVKIPGTELPVDPRILPLTEGQTDVEVSVESGWSGAALYAMGWFGYRWRVENRSRQLDPGDERFAHAALGALAGSFSFELGVDALWGRAPVDQGLELVSARRRLVQLIPTIGADLGPGRVEVTAPIPVAGRNLPSGLGLGVGYRGAWGL